jgi:hypothetical protein
MSRFSISKAMQMIALIAGNLAALRALILDPHSVLLNLLVGLLPLANSVIIGLYLLVRSHRPLRRTARGYGVIAFTAFTGLSLMILLVASASATDRVSDWVVTALDPVDHWLISSGYELHDLETPLFKIVVIPFLVGAVLSGPPLMLGLMSGWLANRYNLVVARRSNPPPTPTDAPLEVQAA